MHDANENRARSTGEESESSGPTTTEKATKDFGKV